MADVASAFKDWSEIAANNGPGGTATVGAGLDDNLREMQKVIKVALGHIASVKDYGAVGDGITDDTAAIQAACDSGKDVFFPRGTYLISEAIAVTTNSQNISGGNKGLTAGFNTQITSADDIEFFEVTGDYVRFEGLFLKSTLNTHSKRHIQSYGADHMMVVNCRIDGTDGLGTGGGVGFGNGAGAVGGSMGLIDHCIISHSSVDVFTPDVKIRQSYIWALSRPYGIKVIAAVGNLQCTNVDVVPPLSTVTGKKAGIYLTGASNLCKFVGCYIDGNTSLNTGVGILAENGVQGLVIDGLTADQCDDNVVVFDSIVAPKLVNSTFKDNNRQGNGSVDILLQDNFAQDMDRCMIRNNTHVMTAAIPSGTTGAAIKVDTTGGRRGLMIQDNHIVQPGAGGGYSDQEIELVDGAFTNRAQGSLRGNIGTRRSAIVSGTHTVPLDDTFETVAYGTTLYYAPRIDQINLSFQGSAITIADHRINTVDPTTVNMGIGFAASHPQFTLGFSIDLE